MRPVGIALGLVVVASSKVFPVSTMLIAAAPCWSKHACSMPRFKAVDPVGIALGLVVVASCKVFPVSTMLIAAAPCWSKHACSMPRFKAVDPVVWSPGPEGPK